MGWRQQRGRRLPAHGGVTGRPEIVEEVALLLAQGIPHREQAFHEAAALGTVGTQAGLTPQHPVPKGSFGLVVGRLDAFVVGEGPQGRVEVEEVGAGRCGLGVGEAHAVAQMNPKAHGQIANEVLEVGPGQGAVADLIPPR